MSEREMGLREGATTRLGLEDLAAARRVAEGQLAEKTLQRRTTHYVDRARMGAEEGALAPCGAILAQVADGAWGLTGLAASSGVDSVDCMACLRRMARR